MVKVKSGTARSPWEKAWWREKEGLVSLLFLFLQDTSCLKMPAEKECPLLSGMALLWYPGWR